MYVSQRGTRKLGNNVSATVTPLAKPAAVARALGLSRKTMTVWKRRGTLVMAGDLVDLAATAAMLKATHQDGPMLAARLAEMVGGAVTSPPKGNGRGTEPVTSPAAVTPRPRLSPIAEAVVSFAERIACEGGCCAWEAGITRSEAEVADRLFREGLITDAAEYLDEHVAPPSGGSWLAEPVWAGIRAARPVWHALEAQRAWEIAEGFKPGQHREGGHVPA